MAFKYPFPFPRPSFGPDTLNQISREGVLSGGLGKDDVEVRNLPPIIESDLPEPVVTQGGLLSDIGSGLLSAGQSVGRGISRTAGLLGEAVREPLASGVRDIPDVMRFYEAQRMSQPMMAYDPAQLKPVTPTGVAGMLPQLRAAEKEAMQKPMLDALKAQADLARASGSGASGVVSAKTYRLPSGDIVETFADKKTLERVYLDEQGNRKRVPMGAIEYSRADVQRSDYFDKKLTDIRTDERRIKALDSYLNSVEGAEQGFKRFFDRIQTSVKTFIDNGQLTQEELSTAEGQAKLQGLLGMFREDIVGGGVMTEFDALRVINALGGNFNSLQNKEVVRKIISNLREQSIPRYQSNVEIYNSQLAQVPAGAATSGVYKPHTLLNFTGQKPTSSSKRIVVSTEDLKKENG